jgi:hypothetical protein
MQFNDTITLNGVKLTNDGYLAANARVARTGIQIYTGAQVGKPDLATVRVYRPESEVFSADAMKSYAHRPVTIDHPSEPVNSANWKDVSVGQTGEEVMRDGETVRVPMVLMDAAAISAVNAGKRELSMGYVAQIDWTDGVTPEGEQYDAVQRNLRMNHLAIVAKARGGSTLKIGDAKPKGGAAMSDLNTMVLDGITVKVPASDTANVKAIFDAKDKALTDANTNLSDAQVKLADAQKQVETLTGEKAVLEKQVTDSAVTPEKLTVMVKDRAALIADASRVIGDAKGLELLDATAIKKAVVTKVLGDAATALSDEAINGAYAMAIKAAPSIDPVRGVVMDGLQTQVTDADTARQAMMAERANAYKGGAA